MRKNTILKTPKTISNSPVDPDNPPWTEDMLGRPVFKRGRGPQKAPIKVLTTVRLDADVIAFFRAQGRGYQTRINDELRKVLTKNLPHSSHSPRARARAKSARTGQ
ncbi:MAG: BrnA antitoxin family protein [Burkholderiales bacterium]